MSGKEAQPTRTERLNHMIWCVENQMEKVWDHREELAGYLRELLASESRERTAREALVAARDVIAALQRQLGVVPGQNGYSATMTAGEIQAAKAVQDLDEIILALRGE